MNMALALTRTIVVQTIVFISLLIWIGRVFATVNSRRVHHIIQIYSFGFCSITTTMGAAIALGFIPAGAEPVKGLGAWFLWFLTGEMELAFGPSVFAAGIFLMYGPEAITRALAWLLNCKPHPPQVVPKRSEARRIALSIAVWTKRKWLIRLVCWITPFNVLSLILVKGFVANAAAICAVELVGAAVGWKAMLSYGAVPMTVGASSALMAAAIGSSFGLKAVNNRVLLVEIVEAFERSFTGIVDRLQRNWFTRFLDRIE